MTQQWIYHCYFNHSPIEGHLSAPSFCLLQINLLYRHTCTDFNVNVSIHFYGIKIQECNCWVAVAMIAICWFYKKLPSLWAFFLCSWFIFLPLSIMLGVDFFGRCSLSSGKSFYPCFPECFCIFTYVVG